MKKIFNYNKFNNDVQDTIVETFVSLSQKFLEGKSETQEYRDANANLTETFMKECVEANPNMTFSGLDMLKNPMVNGDMFFLHRFNTILAGAITPVIPTVIASGYENLYETYQVGWGDNAKYTVESNEMFVVNDIAEGIARGGVQTSYNTEYTVQARPKQVSVYVDWYHVAAGKQDWGRFGVKIGLAYASYIQGKVVKALGSVIADAEKHGIGGYIVNGLTDENWLNY